jgi:hypothetical protein
MEQDLLKSIDQKLGTIVNILGAEAPKPETDLETEESANNNSELLLEIDEKQGQLL